MEAAERTINVQGFLNENRFSPYQWMIFIICLLIAFFDGMDTAAIGYIAPSLLDDWGMEKKDLAPVLSAALFGLTFGALTAGPLGDRFGRRKVLIVSVFVFGLFTLLVAFSSEVWHLILKRFIAGFAMGGIMPMVATLAK